MAVSHLSPSTASIAGSYAHDQFRGLDSLSVWVVWGGDIVAWKVWIYDENLVDGKGNEVELSELPRTQKIDFQVNLNWIVGDHY
jgi:hypothetical protein